LSPGILHLIVPGALEQRTGGYIYDARMVSGLRRRGWTVAVHGLNGRFPGPDREAERSLEGVLAELPDRDPVLIDGLALGALPDPVTRHAKRLQLLALVHHPLCDETGLEPERRVQLRELERQALAACRGIIVSSRFTVRRLQEWLPAGIRIVEVMPGTESVPRAHGPAPGQPLRLLCVGSVVPRKGQDLLVRALKPLVGRDWECVIAGSLERAPGFAAQVRRQMHWAGLEDRVRLIGECDAPTLTSLYTSSSVFVLPSWYEGYGMAFAEAMAYGLPVIATTGGAIPDTVPASAGLLVNPGAVPELTAALEQMLDEPTLRESLSQRAWEHAQSLPDWDSAADHFQDALDVLIPT
jgi:glycosyltransferase involved in cell wall biosynthesis